MIENSRRVRVRFAGEIERDVEIRRRWKGGGEQFFLFFDPTLVINGERRRVTRRSAR